MSIGCTVAVAPWFSPGKFGGGAYLTVDKNVGDLIDWYNVQFYNRASSASFLSQDSSLTAVPLLWTDTTEGTSEYTTCEGLLTESSSTWPNSALFQIAASGITLDKLVIGKPATSSDASNGYMDPSTLATCVEQAQSQGWDAGVMVWEYPDAASSWIETVRADSWPVSGSAPTSTSVSATSTSSSAGSSPTSSGACAGVAAWNSQTAYTGGSQVTYDGDLWTAAYWTYDDVPGGSGTFNSCFSHT